MKKTANIFSIRHSSQFRLFVGIAAALLLTVRVSLPFLHTHTTLESSKQEIAATLHCDACESEATQAIEPEAAIQLPVNNFLFEVKVFETRSPFLSASHSSSESRGPPQNS